MEELSVLNNLFLTSCFINSDQVLGRANEHVKKVTLTLLNLYSPLRLIAEGIPFKFKQTCFRDDGPICSL